jgi:hypothetical protein
VTLWSAYKKERDTKKRKKKRWKKKGNTYKDNEHNKRGYNVLHAYLKQDYIEKRNR